MTRRLDAGSALPMILLLLAVLVGGGGYNYWRNLQAEQAKPRPYMGYSDASLAQLIEAYEAETLAEQGQVKPQRRAEAPRRVGGGLIMDHVNDFERAAAARRANDEEAGKLAGTEAVLRELKAEERHRSNLGEGMSLHLKRLLTI